MIDSESKPPKIPEINPTYNWIVFTPWKTLECTYCFTRHISSDIRELEYKRFVLTHSFCKSNIRKSI